MKKNTVIEDKMHKFLVCAYKSQDFAQNQKCFALLHDCETVTIRNSAWESFKDSSKISLVNQLTNYLIYPLQCNW